jgi:hypothetical protein
MRTTQPEESLARCRTSDDYLDTFYNLLFANAPHLRRQFDGLDMPEQKKRLADALPLLLRLPSLAPDSPELAAAVENHRRAHRGRGDASSYRVWIDTLCATLRRHDPLCCGQTEATVRTRLDRAIELIAHPRAPRVKIYDFVEDSTSLSPRVDKSLRRTRVAPCLSAHDITFEGKPSST